MKLDHVIIAAPDLDLAAERLRDEHGLASVAGGEHPGLGTGNRIVPLGDSYLELMGIADFALASQNPLGQMIIEGNRRWIGWCLSVDDIDLVAERLGLTVLPMSRRRPDGSELSWRLAGLDVALRDLQLPFFICWDDLSQHPGLEHASHREDPTGIAWIEVAGDQSRIHEWLGGAELPIRHADASDGLQSIAVGTSKGEIVLR